MAKRSLTCDDSLIQQRGRPDTAIDIEIEAIDLQRHPHALLKYHYFR